jgi:hypothetical protein
MRPAFWRVTPAIWCAVALLAWPTPAVAADPPDRGPRSLVAHPVLAAISVDGRLDEDAWKEAEVASDFVQLDPTEGHPATRRTEVRVLYGPSALYIGALLEDDPALVRRPLSRRDEIGSADAFFVTIDGYGTGRSAYVFGVTAAGVQYDAVNELGSIDRSWDAVWQSAVRLTPEGWVVEMAIPYSMLRFNEGPEQTWWIQFQRTISRNNERVYWQPLAREDLGVGFIGGRLTELRGLSRQANVQVRPYSLSRLTRAPEEGVGAGYAHHTGFNVGADVKVGLGSNLILDAAINPDFGQVEADPEVLNLTTFESFFPERRPFFLEGTAIFDYVFAPGDGSMLYTRRMGGLGRIVGAGKLTGRTLGGIGFGIVAAATSDGFESRYGELSYTGEDFQPNLIYTAGRVKREFGDRSSVGAAATYFDGFGGDLVYDHYRSLVAGTDWDVRFANGAYRFDGALTGSHLRFSDTLGIDPQSGFALYTGLDRIRGTVTGGLSVRLFSDAFEPNDIGFFREGDIVRVHGWGQTLFNGGRPFGPFRLALGGVMAHHTWTYAERTNLGSWAQWYTWWHTRNAERIGVRGAFVGLGGYDVRETRGLGPVTNSTGTSLTVEYTTDTRRAFQLTPRLAAALYDGNSLRWNAEMAFSWTASDRLALSASARYDHRDNIRAWVANEAFRYGPDGYGLGAAVNRLPTAQSQFLPLDGDPLGLESVFAGLPIFGAHEDVITYYAAVFGAREQRSVDTSVRATYTFTPVLSLQLYSQLFAARFQYDDFRVLGEPDDFRSLETYPRRLDEARQSLNLNSVLRWEYRPGSTVFFVWAHNRFDRDGGYRLHDGLSSSPFDRGTFGLARDTFDLPPTNIVLVKLNYLLMR